MRDAMLSMCFRGYYFLLLTTSCQYNDCKAATWNILSLPGFYFRSLLLVHSLNDAYRFVHGVSSSAHFLDCADRIAA
jgi:hypothetical protein